MKKVAHRPENDRPDELVEAAEPPNAHRRFHWSIYLGAPWSAPDRYLSLRDANGEERAFVSDTRLLDRASRAAVEAALARAGFVLDVVRVNVVEEDFELRTFDVETEQGRRRFQTPLDTWPREVDGGGLVLQDVYGDLFGSAT